MRWAARVPGGRTVDDLVGFVDVTATILDAAGVKHPSREYPPSGRSLMNILTSRRQGMVDETRTAIYAARERHSSARYNNWTYPQRALRTRSICISETFARTGGRPGTGPRRPKRPAARTAQRLQRHRSGPHAGADDLPGRTTRPSSLI